jgi:hypothetical protein
LRVGFPAFFFPYNQFQMVKVEEYNIDLISGVQ